MAGNPRTLSNAHLVFANGNEYPDVHYTPSTDITRVHRDILKYVHANNKYSQGTLLNVNNLKSLFGFLYFELVVFKGRRVTLSQAQSHQDTLRSAIMVSIFNNTLLNYIPGCKRVFTRTQYTTISPFLE